MTNVVLVVAVAAEERSCLVDTGGLVFRARAVPLLRFPNRPSSSFSVASPMAPPLVPWSCLGLSSAPPTFADVSLPPSLALGVSDGIITGVSIVAEASLGCEVMDGAGVGGMGFMAEDRAGRVEVKNGRLASMEVN